VPPDPLGHDAPEIALVAAAVHLGVGVHHLSPASGKRNADAEPVTGGGREIGQADEPRPAPAIAPEEDEGVLIDIGGVDPLEAGGLVGALPERGWSPTAAGVLARALNLPARVTYA